jgi:hypothetical protein
VLRDVLQFFQQGGIERCTFDIAAVFAAEEISPHIRTECGLSHKAEFVAVCGNLF